MTNEEKRKIYAALSAPFPEEAIERTDGRLTGRGYSTTGIKAQYIVNRMNEVLGLGNWRVHRTITVRPVTTAKGRPAFEAICDVTLEFGEWTDTGFVCWAEALADGGHTAMSEADARKGAMTNAIKRAAAFLGCGRQAYEGTIDEDNVPGPEVGEAPRQRREREPVPHATHATQGPQEASRSQASGAAGWPTGGGSAQPLGQPDATGASHASGAAGQTNRTRLTSKQSGAIWSMVAKLNYDKSDFRRKVREKYGCQPEFLSRQQASEMIGILAGQLGGEPLHANGAAGGHPQAGA